MTAPVRAPFERVSPSQRPHGCHFLSHGLNLYLHNFSDFAELVNVALVVGRQRIEKVAHVVFETSNHFFELIPAPF